MHEFASSSVKATGKYPISQIVRTADEDLEIDSDDDMFALDPPAKGRKPSKAKAKGDKVLQAGNKVMPPSASQGKGKSKAKSSPKTAKVGQFAPRPTLRAPPRLRAPPQRLHAMRVTLTPDITVECSETSLPSKGQVGYEPANIREARAHSTWPMWKAAMKKEVDGLLGRGTWVEVQRQQVPKNVKIMGSQFIFKDKISGPKARLVVRGFQQSPKPGRHKTFSPTPSATEFRILAALATQYNWPMHSCDIAQAFTQSHPLKPGEELYVHPPVGYDHTPGTVWRLKKPLYGLCIAPKAWFDTLKEFIVGFGFESINCSDTFFVYKENEETVHLVFHVDDLLFSFSDDDLGLRFKTALLTRFEGTDDGLVERFVGIDIKRDEYHTHLSQTPLAESLLADFAMTNCTPVKTPMEPHTLLTAQGPDDPPDDPENPVSQERYQHLVETLLYLTVWTRPDLVFATHQLAKWSHDPHRKHMAAAMRVLKYLKGTKELGITYTRGLSDENRLLGWADADWAACTVTRRSISGYVSTLNGGAVSWKCRQQKSVATSTSEAEYVSASRASDDILFLRRVLDGTDNKQRLPTPLYEDNRSCRMMSENPVSNDRSKHIDYCVLALRERVKD